MSPRWLASLMSGLDRNRVHLGKVRARVGETGESGMSSVVGMSFGGEGECVVHSSARTPPPLIACVISSSRPGR